ncbi:hypothetical protein A2164_02595 [Candidatus Curtissbacteria bacterium RBG_13_35_7]|uniref:PAS domain-containing protein n=1 Tax=Candidatus Curtissbacteria bacterium RBG_13_35_7 TaxID=1797705 RepID=A0A1F5G4L1_9BACT|nr:MAG: hypothetical protein A2164_02595 [Candidatus Curtissbacteria bacterium RBG_13_35_7]
MKVIPALISLIYFLILGFGSSYILQKEITLQNLMQIFFILIILAAVSSKVVLPKILQPLKTYATLLLLMPIILFIYILILSTGITQSPYLILTHFFAIGLAFLLAPQIAISFISATVFLILTNIFLDQSLAEFLSQSPFLNILYLISYIALIPFSYILAKEYKIKEEWARILEQQIATSKSQEEELLKNITEIIIVIDPQFNIVYLNQAATKFTKYGNEAIKQDFYKLFKFKDGEGRDLFPYSLPFLETIKSKAPQILENLQIQTKEKTFTKIDMKIIPAITQEKPLGLILIIQDRSHKDYTQKKVENITTAALGKFLDSLTRQKTVLHSIKQNNISLLQLNNLINQNLELSRFAQDFVYTLKLESGEIGALSDLLDLGEIIQDIMAEELIRAQDFNIMLYSKPQETEQEIVQPRSKSNIFRKHKIFPEVYITGNKSWIRNSVQRILELVYRTSYKNSIVTLNVKRIENMAKIEVVSPKNKLQAPQAYDLFEKFHGSLAMHPDLLTTSGLEGYIAKSLLERMGASIKISSENETNLIFEITFGIKEETLKPNPEIKLN